jgi:acyl dehydratase
MVVCFWGSVNVFAVLDRTFFCPAVEKWGVAWCHAKTEFFNRKAGYREVLMAGTLKVGNRAVLTKTFSEEEVCSFADLSGDRNPLHLDNKFGAASVFGRRIVHGMLVAGLFSGLIGMELPGPGSIYLGQNLVFRAPVFIGDTVTVSVEITKVRQDKPIITLQTLCVKDAGTVVIEGEAVVKAPAA